MIEEQEVINFFEEQEVINFFTDKGWSKEDINKYKGHLIVELNLFSTVINNFSIEYFYNKIMSQCGSDEYERHCKHLWAHQNFKHGLITDLITSNRRTNLWMFIMIILFIGYSFFLK